jgi:hypothetical protein
MADITKCTGDYCELRESCYRFKAIENEFRQAYFSKAPNLTSYECDMYWQYCDKCHQFNGIHKLSCSTIKIEIRL